MLQLPSPLFALLGVLLLAAAWDWHSRRIPNWLTLGLGAIGLAVSWTGHGAVHPVASALGLLTGFGLTVLLFAIGALGGGDVKLMAAVGAWLGPAGTLAVFLAAAVVGMILVLAQCAAQGRLAMLVRNSALIAINLLHVRELGVAHVSQTGLRCRSAGKPLPYAIPVLLATVSVILWMKGIWK